MGVYADTGLILSLFINESATDAADRAIAAASGPVLLSPLTRLEFRNALNLGIARGRLTEAGRDAAWQAFDAQTAAGVFVLTDLDAHAVPGKAAELSDRHTPRHLTRSLDLLHVAAAVLLGATEFLSFDARQRRAAEAEGLAVRP